MEKTTEEVSFTEKNINSLIPKLAEKFDKIKYECFEDTINKIFSQILVTIKNEDEISIRNNTDNFVFVNTNLIKKDAYVKTRYIRLLGSTKFFKVLTKYKNKYGKHK